MDYNMIFIKFALGMICLILQINIMGKGNLAPNNALDQLQNYVLGGIIGGIIYNQDITILQFLMVLVIWTIIVAIIRFATNHNHWIRNVINGRPVVLVQNGHVLVDNCLKMGLSANDLMFKLRERGIYELSRVKSGILEQNGQLVVIENDEENIKFPIIADGIINQDVLELIHHDESWLTQEVQKHGFPSVNDVFLGEYIHGELRLTAYPEDQ